MGQVVKNRAAVAIIGVAVLGAAGAAIVPLQRHSTVATGDPFGPRPPRQLQEPPTGTCCYYELSPSDAAQLAEHLASLRIGMAKQDVVARLGSPQFHVPINSKGLLSLHRKGTLIGYWFRRWKEQPDDRFDRKVVLLFDARDALARVDSYAGRVKDLP
jgi:hypothetical protein